MINVIDAICGSGKTTHIFNVMRSQPDKRWLFVSPYLAETGDGCTKGRIQKELPELRFLSPAKAPSKEKDFIRLAEAGNNIAITHSLFFKFSPEIAEILKENEYHLIIDETIDLVTNYNDLDNQDVKALINAKMVIVADNGRLDWNELDYPNYKGRDKGVKDLCDTKALYLYGKDVLIQRVPPTIIQACKSCTILTYLFEGSLMSAWMKLNNLEYQKEYPKALRSESEIKAIIRKNLELVLPSRKIMELNTAANGLPLNHVFSATWYRTNKDKLPMMKSSIEKSLKDMGKGNVFWTTFKDYQTDLQGIRYTKKVKVAGMSEPRSPFVAKNMRASNEYADCTNCIHTVNVYPHMNLSSYLAREGVRIDESLYAVSELIQFIFRGSIRNHKPMKLLILSNRMRNLLRDWLTDGKHNPENNG